MPDPGLEIRGEGGRSSRALHKGGGAAGLQKKIFRPFGPQFGLKIRGGEAGPHLDLPLHTLGKQNKQAKAVY